VVDSYTETNAEGLGRQRIGVDANELPDRTSVLCTVRPLFVGGVGDCGDDELGECLTMVERV
jgi:hypothetical protein